MEKNYDFKLVLDKALNREENELPKHFDALKDICFHFPQALGLTFDEFNLSDERKELGEIEERLRKLMSEIQKKVINAEFGG